MAERSLLSNNNGFIILNKPTGISSAAALRPLKKYYKGKIGHTGTLDPLATGMLVIALGQACKFAQYQLRADKSYRAGIRLGYQTDTDDITGKTVATAPIPKLSKDCIQQCLASEFTGEILQTPPQYSALKFQGKAYYQYARAGKHIECKARQVRIHSYSNLSYSPGDGIIHIDIHCGSGTYIRALARDIGEALQTRATIESLHRLSVSPWSAEQALPLHCLASSEAITNSIHPIDSVLQHIKAIHLGAKGIADLQNGRPYPYEQIDNPDYLRIYSNEGIFCGLARPEAGYLYAQKMLIQQ